MPLIDSAHNSGLFILIVSDLPDLRYSRCRSPAEAGMTRHRASFREDFFLAVKGKKYRNN